MNRTVVMTLGFLLVFFGIQLNVVDSYVLTPRMANFLSDQFSESQTAPAESQNIVAPGQQPAPFSQAAYSTNRTSPAIPARSVVNRVIRPPGWLGWPIMFLGAVFFLNGLSIRQ